jgi:hypothetical protein
VAEFVRKRTRVEVPAPDVVAGGAQKALKLVSLASVAGVTPHPDDVVLVTEVEQRMVARL